MRRSALVAVGAAIFLIGLIVLFPARVAYHWFGPATVELSGISGTIWNGRAAEGAVDQLYLANVTWDFAPLTLFTGKAGYAITAEPVSGFIETDVAISLGGSISVSNLNGRVPLSALGGLLPMNGIDGRVTLEFDSLTIRDGLPIEAAGNLELANLVVRALSPSPLGTYRALFSTTDDIVSGKVEDVSGMLDLAGTLELRPDRSYSLTGGIAATNTAPPNIVQQLSYLGSANAEGRRPFRFEGRL